MDHHSTQPRVPDGQRLFLGLLLGSAGVVTVLRFFTLTELTHDLAMQVQAAQHLLAGRGLTVYGPASNDLAQLPELYPLTWWPAGYSLFSAPLLAMGLPVALLVKVYGAVCTLLGWWGWGRFALACFGPSLERKGLWRWGAYLAAVASPLSLTCIWHGTDVFLWAAVPWVLLWLSTAAVAGKQRGLWLDACAGAVCGSCILMRYAAVVLAGYAGLVILAQCGRRWTALLSRWVVFSLAAAPFLAVQIYFLAQSQAGNITPGGVGDRHGKGDYVAGFVAGAKLLPRANYPLVAWAPSYVQGLVMLPGRRALWLRAPCVYGLTLALLSLPWWVARTTGVRSLAEAFTDRRVVGAGFVAVVPLFLWASMTLGQFPYLVQTRYFVPVIPLATFLVWYLGSASESREQASPGWIRSLCLAASAGFLAVSALGLVWLALPGTLGQEQRVRLMGESDLKTFPHLGLAYESWPARQYVVARLRAEPDIVLLSHLPYLFFADPTVAASRIWQLHRSTFGPGCKLFVRGPATILILAYDLEGEGDTVIPSFDTVGERFPAPGLASLPDLRLLKRFHADGFPDMKVLESRVPAGVTVRLDGNKSQPSVP